MHSVLIVKLPSGVKILEDAERVARPSSNSQLILCQGDLLLRGWRVLQKGHRRETACFPCCEHSVFL